MIEKDEKLAEKYNIILPHLNEKQKRLYLASEAIFFGFGGITKVNLATGVSKITIGKAIKELKNKKELVFSGSMSRKPGGGRKRAEVINPDLWSKLQLLIEPHVRGEPESALLWTSKSTRKLSTELKQEGISVSHRAIGELLKVNNFSLQANRKTNEGKTSKDRDEQFNYINKTVLEFQKNDQPVISIDAKKKELVGNFKNGGQEWQGKGQGWTLLNI